MARPPHFTPMSLPNSRPAINLPSLLIQNIRPPVIAAVNAAAAAAPARPQATSTVFVGNICEKADNDFIKRILEECGTVVNWRRIKGTNEKYQSFGFCDYGDNESTLRALRVLNDFQIGQKKLNVKVEARLREQLMAFAKAEAGPNAPKPSGDDLPASEEALKKDEEVRLSILAMIEVDHPELVTAGEEGEVSDKEKEEKKKDEVKVKKRDDESRRAKDDRRRRRSDSRGRSRDRGRRGDSPRNKRRRRSYSRSSSRSSSSSSRSSSSSGTHSSRGHSKRRRSRSPKSGRASSEDSDAARERRILKKAVKEKEIAYNARLKMWEERERKQAKRYERDEAKEKSRKLDVLKEAKKLKAFLEDYDDEKDDLKYYKQRDGANDSRSSSLFARRREFEREKEADAKDRQKEQQEIEELKRQILEEGKKVEEVDAEARRRHAEKEEKAASKGGRDGSGSPNPHQKLGRPPMTAKQAAEDDEEEGGSSSSESGASVEEEGEEAEKTKATLVAASKWTSLDASGDQSGASSSATPVALHQSASSPRLAFRTASPVPLAPSSAPSAPSTAPIRIGRPAGAAVASVFGGDEEDDPLVGKKKLKLFEITQEERLKTMTPGEMKKMQKEIADSIPADKNALYSWNIAWKLLDKSGGYTRIQAWVAKKIKEYIGEDEPTLVTFISDQLRKEEQPDRIKEDIRMVLDDEADVFVTKLWRLLVYESECASKGVPGK